MNIFNTNKIGNKANSLHILREEGLPVPSFIVITPKELATIFPLINLSVRPELLNNDNDIIQYAEKNTHVILQTNIPNQFIKKLDDTCKDIMGKDYFVSVRSSAISEDTESSSYAGQYTTCLYVSYSELVTSIKQCISSVWSSNVIKYMMLREGRFVPSAMSIIIQQMVTAKFSGVLFTRDVTGNMNNMIISAGIGMGEGVVAGKIPTDTFRIDRIDRSISKMISHKDSALQYDASIKKVSLFEADTDIANQPSLNENQLMTLFEMGIQIEKIWSKPMDIEFSIDKNGKIWLLQARPITTIKPSQLKILDSTNIAESYPGLTLPLTIDFARNCYYHVFKGTSKAIGIDADVEDILSHLIGSTNGRVYYRLDNWYKMMSLVLPGKSSIKNWEKSVGLKHGESDNLKIPIHKKIKAWVRLLYFLINHKKWTYWFFKEFDTDYQRMMKLDFQNSTASDIYKCYLELSEILFSKWYPTLVNDLLTFRSFGLLQSFVKSLDLDGEQNLANDLLCGIEGIESEMPLITLLELTEAIKQDPVWFLRFKEESAETLYKSLEQENNTSIYKKLHYYLQQYGDRTIGELKLEITSPRQKPTLLISMIKNRLDSTLTAENIKQKQLYIRQHAEEKVKQVLPKYSLKTLYYNYIITFARNTVRNRENMRFCRTRAYGFVKEVFISIGVKMEQAGIIASPEDIFYLNLNVVEDFCLKDNHTLLQHTIKLEKENYSKYEKKSLPNRIMYQNESLPFFEDDILEKPCSRSELSGTAVSQGEVKANVIIVKSPTLDIPVKGSILVTKTTDPGWIFLMSQASGLISEKGSLLSHTAIVGRELGIPTIVGVANATTIIQSGDVVFMDGAKGIIKIITA